ncbi:MAG: 4Fe-4S dicluster domain-containing protein [Clostridia bacterium]|nr:4Fe-4S dicluster domain-containing protein [Clostridia bacterium]
MARIVFNQGRCTGCRACEGACKQENNLPVGVRWRVVTHNLQGQYPDLKKIYQSSACSHCGKPKCSEACPSGAIKKQVENGIVLVDEAKCNGCGECIKACPFGVMAFDKEKQKAGKCTLCINRLNHGLGPACVVNCLALALEFKG